MEISRTTLTIGDRTMVLTDQMSLSEGVTAIATTFSESQQIRRSNSGFLAAASTLLLLCAGAGIVVAAGRLIGAALVDSATITYKLIKANAARGTSFARFANLASNTSRNTAILLGKVEADLPKLQQAWAIHRASTSKDQLQGGVKQWLLFNMILSKNQMATLSGLRLADQIDAESAKFSDMTSNNWEFALAIPFFALGDFKGYAELREKFLTNPILADDLTSWLEEVYKNEMGEALLQLSHSFPTTGAAGSFAFDPFRTSGSLSYMSDYLMPSPTQILRELDAIRQKAKEAETNALTNLITNIVDNRLQAFNDDEG